MTIAIKTVRIISLIVLIIFCMLNYAKCTQGESIFNSVEQSVLGEKNMGLQFGFQK